MKTTTMIDVSSRTLNIALKYLYRAIPMGPDEQKELYGAITRIERAIAQSKKPKD